MRLGIFGGSFDPVHLGHLQLADCCLRLAALDEVWFTPAAVQPLKQHGPRASNDQRCAMLSLALAGHADWQLCRMEIDRGGVSYTVDTLTTIQEDQPTAELYLPMGADSLHQLPEWKRPAEICQLATPLVVGRPGEPDPDFSVLLPLVGKRRMREIEQQQIEMRETPISSSEIRRMIATGENVDELLPPAVAEYIADERLYR